MRARSAPAPPPAQRPFHSQADTPFAARLELAARHHRRIARMPAIAPTEAARPALAELERRGKAPGDAASCAEGGRGETEQLGAESAQHRDVRAVDGSLSSGERADKRHDQMARHRPPTHADIGVGRAPDLERPAGGRGRGVRIRARQVEREARAKPVGQRHRNRPLDDVVEGEAGPEVITVEYDTAARSSAGDGGGLLRHEPRRHAAPEPPAFHYGRLKTITVPLVADTN